MRDTKTLEREAQQHFDNHRYHEAASLYYDAALVYSKQQNHPSAALCFASAAGCMARQFGEKTFSHVAAVYEKAAKEAESTCDWDYAALMYKHAAICYERDVEYLGFAECFYKYKEYSRKALIHTILSPSTNFRQKMANTAEWITLTISSALWGHGERPQRTFFFGLFFIVFCAFFYTFGHLRQNGEIFKPHFFQALYFSIVTFTTVGYGDITPVGFNKVMVSMEALSGLLIAPVFITALCRKYLRF